MSATPDPDWFAFLRVGDVIQEGSHGSLRVVREISRWERIRRGVVERGAGPLRYVTLAIRRPSWTRRCYTVLSASDLKQRRFRYVGARVQLTSELDTKIAAAIHQPCFEPFILRAKDVRGVA